MDKNVIEQYKQEMLNMYKKSKNLKPTKNFVEAAVYNPPTENSDSQKGSLIAIVTALRGIYPVENAEVTVFTGNIGDKQVIDKAFTDSSGRTRPFLLDTPNKQISLEEQNDSTPYSAYNLEIKAEGYRDNVHINIPIFSGVTSLQRSNMMLLETAGEDKGPQIFDESQRFDL